MVAIKYEQVEFSGYDQQAIQRELQREQKGFEVTHFFGWCCILIGLCFLYPVITAQSFSEIIPFAGFFIAGLSFIQTSKFEIRALKKDLKQCKKEVMVTTVVKKEITSYEENPHFWIYIPGGRIDALELDYHRFSVGGSILIERAVHSHFILRIRNS